MTHLIFALKKNHTRLHCGTRDHLWLCQQLKILSFHSQYRIIPQNSTLSSFHTVN